MGIQRDTLLSSIILLFCDDMLGRVQNLSVACVFTLSNMPAICCNGDINHFTQIYPFKDSKIPGMSEISPIKNILLK